MRAQSSGAKERPVIGWSPICAEPGARDAEYDALWKHYEPKIRRMAGYFRIEGAVGAELDDLVQIGQAILLQALRRHDASKSRFSTYFYTCLRNEYIHLLKRCFPRRRYIVTAWHPRTGRRQLIKCTVRELEGTLTDLRAGGWTYAVIPKTASTRYPMLENMVALDAPPSGDDDDSRSFCEIIAAPEQPLTVDEIVERIRHRITNPRLRKIAVWLFEGRAMSGRKGIARKVGLRKHQAERAMHKIRMLLAGEFGMSVANTAGESK